VGYGRDIGANEDEYVEVLPPALGERDGLLDEVVASDEESQADSDYEGYICGYVEDFVPGGGHHCLWRGTAVGCDDGDQYRLTATGTDSPARIRSRTVSYV
jgi:hypothetical protein